MTTPELKVAADDLVDELFHALEPRPYMGWVLIAFCDDGEEGEKLDLAVRDYHAGDPADVGRVLREALEQRDEPAVELDWVYLMERPGLLKIGRTSDPERRARDLSNASGERVVLLRKVWMESAVAARAAELDLHRRFAAHRALGEWFADVPEIREYFARLPADVLPSTGQGGTRRRGSDGRSRRRCRGA